MDKATLEDLLRVRFEAQAAWHPDTGWQEVSPLLERADWNALTYMEETAGEPALVFNPESNQWEVWDCAQESPKGRRSLCYDRSARLARNKNAPLSSCEEEAQEHGILLLDESEYLWLQAQGDFDLKTSSWIATPESIRDQGGAIFGEKRYGRTFVFANSADSYYSSRGFRAKLSL